MNNVILEQTEQGEMPTDIYYVLSKNRVLFLDEFIDDRVAVDVCATMMLKEQENDREKISLFINCGGGDIRNIFMIYDTMTMLKCPIETVCMGSSDDECTLLLAAGTPGMRFATKNSTITISQLIHDKFYYSDLTDAKSLLDRFKQDNDNFVGALAKHLKQKPNVLAKQIERRKFLSPKQALKMNVIDKVVALGKNK